jgi:ribosomal protein uL23
MDPYTIIKNPLSTEKSIRLMESENKLIFVVDMKANKKDIKEAIESIFKAKVTKVNTFVTTKGQKRAYIKFSEETPAIDIATEMGLI